MRTLAPPICSMCHTNLLQSHKSIRGSLGLPNFRLSRVANRAAASNTVHAAPSDLLCHESTSPTSLMRTRRSWGTFQITSSRSENYTWTVNERALNPLFCVVAYGDLSRRWEVLVPSTIDELPVPRQHLSRCPGSDAFIERSPADAATGTGV